MSKYKTAVIIIALVLIAAGVVWGNKGNQKELTNPAGKQAESQPVAKPSTQSYNPPQEVKYSSSTDLKKELDSVDPKVLDEDFDGL